MMWVCKTFFKIRETQRTSNHCILMRRSEDIVDQSLTPPKQRLGGGVIGQSLNLGQAYKQGGTLIFDGPIYV